jgi:crotonobetainyl-CoA:carnitine CoA-transferase CaiB-like acyl-CoA transferase
MLLGDLGADVIKVERPGDGDDTRHWGPPFVGDQSAYFLCCNRNKRSITLNLHSPAGQRLARRLAAKCDVVLENFLPGTMERFGLGYDALAEVNPGIVYASISGYGQTGPRRDEPGYDILIQAMAGVMSVTGDPESSPMKVGVAISDITAGLFAANAILAALLARSHTGRGERIDLALFDATLAWLANVGSNYPATGQEPLRHGNAHPSIVPYQSFDTADQPIIVAVGNDDQWRRFCIAVERGDWAADSRYTTSALRVRHRETLIAAIAAWLRSQASGTWLRQLHNHQVPSGLVNTVSQALADPQVAARKMVLESHHPTAGTFRMVASPLKLQSQISADFLPPPLLGQHTEQVLQDLLALDTAAIAELRRDAVI